MNIGQSSKLDYLGFSTSLLCAIHCAILPFLLTLSSFSSLAFLENPVIEGGTIAISLVIAVTSLMYSYLFYHKKKSALVLASIGFSIIIMGQFYPPEIKTIFMVSGAIIIASSHIINLALCKNCTQKQVMAG